jgi:hypothetical protein
MKRTVGILVLGVCLALPFGVAAHADDDESGEGKGRAILAFDTMYGVDGPFVSSNQIRGVLGDELPWAVRRVSGFLKVDGHLKISVHGLVFANEPGIVPPDKIGINDEPTFRGLVSCLIEDGTKIGMTNIMTGEFPATPTGDSKIDAHITLPDQCVAPIVFILAGSEAKWFAVTGAEPGH